MLEACGIAVDFPDRSRRTLFRRTPFRRVLSEVDLEIAAGEAVGVVGESGSGKTTLGRTVLRLHEPAEGRIVFRGQDVTHLPESALRSLRDRKSVV